MTDVTVPRGDEHSELAPPLGRRFAALLVDWILCILAAGLFADPLVYTWAPLVVLVAEYAIFVGLFGQTPGMRLLGMNCLGQANGRPVGVPRALVRGVLLALVLPALIMDGRKRGLHDRAAGTMIRAVTAVHQ